MMNDKPDCNTDEQYHRSLTDAQLRFELDHHNDPIALKHYSKSSIDKRIKLITKILLELAK